MSQTSPSENLFNIKFFPQQVMLLSVAEYMMPMGYWTVISKEPFRFLICMQMGNYTFDLLKKYREAVLHFFPWSERQKIIKAGNISGRHENKAQKLGFELLPAKKIVAYQSGCRCR
jgi:flavin reductase (DIM6/NTAB) family NADH-FMN oxidoreductase RutF